LPHNLDGLVIGDSLVRREANKPLTLLKEQLLSGMEKINSKITTSFHTLSQKELEKHKANLTDEEYLRLSGAIGIRDITTQTFEHLQTQKKYDSSLLGENLTKQQTYLRENLQVSIPKLDHLVSAALSAGALGAKLTGAGLGGCIIAYAPDKEQEVAEAIARNGGKAIYCKTDIGAQRDEDCLNKH
jgi:galactokinase